MTDIEAAFVADIVANPADDTPRLIYADWLEDDGRTERAEFIRVQCEIARADDRWESLRGHQCPPMPRGAYGQMMPSCDVCGDMTDLECRLFDLRNREIELANAHLASWCGMPGWTTLTGSDEWGNPANGRPWSVFRRGFVALVRCPLQTWLDHGPALRRAHPIEAVTLTDVRPHKVNPDKCRYQFAPAGAFAEGATALPASMLPACLRPHMRRNAGTCHDDPAVRDAIRAAARACCYDYRTEADALADVNWAALAWAESGLLEKQQCQPAGK